MAADTKKNQILILGPPVLFTRGDYGERLSHRFQVLNPYTSSLPLHQFLSAHAHATQAVLCNPKAAIRASLLDQLPSLRLIVTTSIGLDHIDLSECRRRRISVAYASHLFTYDVADFAVGMLLDVLRKITAADGFVRKGLWPAQLVYPLGVRLSGKRVGIVGLGRIGSEVAKRLEAFGCIISYLSRNKKASVPYRFYAEVCDLASNNDILIICCALNDQTRHLINKEVLLALGKKGVIVNIARGAVIDEKELIECLQRREIAGAGLDVFENEPNVSDELFKLSNVVMSPHCAVSSEEIFEALYELICGNFAAFFSNKPLLSPVPE